MVGNIGTNDCTEYTQKERILWKNMIHRVQGHQAYADCSICDRWLSLNNFVSDLRKMKNYSKWLENPTIWVLDKDIRYKGNKIYSPQACQLVHTSINNKYENKPKCIEYNAKVYQCREYYAIHTDGTKIVFNNQKKFAREYGLDFRNVSRSIKKGGRTKGWFIEEITD